MVDRATVNQQVQIGVEVTPGTAVPANKVLRSISITPGPEGENDMFRPEGHKWPAIAVPGMEWSSADLAGRPTYTEICYPLESMFGAAAVVADGTNGKKRVYEIGNPAVTPKTWTVEQGDASRAHRLTYALVSALGLEISRQANTLSGSLFGQLLADGITITAAPDEIALKVVAPKHWDIFLDDTAAGIGTTKLLRVFRCNPSFGNRWGPIWPINSAAPSHDGHIELVPSGTVNLGVGADAVGMGLLPVFRAGTTRFLRARALGDAIAGAVASQYTLQIDLALKIQQTQRFEDFDGVYGVGFAASIVADDDWGKAGEITVINEIAAL